MKARISINDKPGLFRKNPVEKMQLVSFCVCFTGKKIYLDIPAGVQKPQTQAAVVAINCSTEG